MKFINYLLKTNRQFISTVFDDLYKNLPDNIKQNIIKINFIDITTNMPKVLDILSNFTGKEITPNVVASYKKYLLHQNLPQRYLDILYNK